MSKYIHKPLLVDAELYKEGMEDYFKYYIPMFGLFTKQECIDSEFTPDFEKDKMAFINTQNGEVNVVDGFYIATDREGNRSVYGYEEFHKRYS